MLPIPFHFPKLIISRFLTTNRNSIKLKQRQSTEIKNFSNSSFQLKFNPLMNHKNLNKKNKKLTDHIKNQSNMMNIIMSQCIIKNFRF
jgi:hypothetical protein